MTKIAIITDSHFGARSDSPHFLNHFEWFYKQIFFSELDQQNINHLIHLGDLVERRKYINYVTANRMRKAFIEPLLARGIKTDILVGNHDAYYRDHNNINAIEELIESELFHIHAGPVERYFDGRKVLFIPWVCDDNRELSLKMIQESTAKVCMGHLELMNFEVYRGHVIQKGMDPSLFSRFNFVLSGHYHHQQVRGNVRYLGAPYEMNWNDWDSPKGFWILDTDGPALQFIENPEVMHRKVYYDDHPERDEQIIAFEFDSCQDKMVKVIVEHRENHHLFDNFIEELEKRAAKVQVIDEGIVQIGPDEGVDNVSNPFDVLMELIGETKVEVPVNELQVLMKDLYTEAAQA